jgi:hypothetical protein
MESPVTFEFSCYQRTEVLSRNAKTHGMKHLQPPDVGARSGPQDRGA